MTRSHIIYAILASALAICLAFMLLVVPIDFALGQLPEAAGMNVGRTQVDSDCVRAGGYTD